MQPSDKQPPGEGKKPATAQDVLNNEVFESGRIEAQDGCGSAVVVDVLTRERSCDDLQSLSGIAVDLRAKFDAAADAMAASTQRKGYM